MAKTFLELTNELLDEVNEVRLTSVNFSSAKNIQRFAKTCINRAYRDIHTEKYKWPWNADPSANDYLGNHYIDLTVGQRWHLLKTGSADANSDFAYVDTDSFTLTEEGVSGETPPYVIRDLIKIPMSEWKRLYSASEKMDDTDGQTYGVPQRIIINPDNRYIGFSPIPDKAYRVYFYAWNQITELSAYDDVIAMPDRFAHVLIARARYYIWKFKENEAQARSSLDDFNDGIKRMVDSVAPFPERMTDDRVGYV